VSRTNRRGPGRPTGRTGPDAFQPGPASVVGDTATFQAAAAHLFGGHGWVGETARRMGVNEATIWRWVNTSTAPPGPALAAMTAWVRLHALGQPLPDPPPAAE
jgi:hypothetical protein